MNRSLASLLVLPVALAVACSSSESREPPVVSDPSALAAPAAGEGFQFPGRPLRQPFAEDLAPRILDQVHLLLALGRQADGLGSAVERVGFL